MVSEARHFDYVALDGNGRHVKGSVAALNDLGAFEQLKRQGFAPLEITPALTPARPQAQRRLGALSDREVADFLSDLAALLRAGSNMRAALGVIAVKAERERMRQMCRNLVTDISGGSALDLAFSRALGTRHAFVSAFVSAGEAAGDLAGAFERSAELLNSQLRLRDQLVSVASYPAFVLVSAIVAAAVILLFVIPSLGPLVEQGGKAPPMTMRILLTASSLLRDHVQILLLGVAAIAGGLLLAARAGVLAAGLDRLALNGPFRKTVNALVYGAFAVSLGNMLTAGAPMADALRLALRAVRSPIARERIEPATQTVRQGRSLSDALAKVPGFPPAIVRLTAIGEASGGLGAMLSRAGKLEEDAALRRIETLGRLVGPVLIITLGGLVGMLMASLLSGLTSIGDQALG